MYFILVLSPRSRRLLRLLLLLLCAPTTVSDNFHNFLHPFLRHHLHHPSLDGCYVPLYTTPNGTRRQTDSLSMVYAPQSPAPAPSTTTTTVVLGIYFFY